MPEVTIKCTSGSRRAERTAIIGVHGDLVTISLRTPSGSSNYPRATVRLQDLTARLDRLDQQETRIPLVEGENDLTVAASDGDVWLWVRSKDREDGGADVMVDAMQLRIALSL